MEFRVIIPLLSLIGLKPFEPNSEVGRCEAFFFTLLFDN
jgi:hypothetical protein